MVLGITRNALGLTSMPPNQVLAGLALFISLFIMGPTLSAVNEEGIQPYLKGDKTQSQAFKDGVEPLREFMWKTTREDEIALLIKVSGQEQPANKDDVELTTLIPAFVLSELRAAFIIGFVIFIPFLIIDMVVSASLMSLGMMMLPPVTVAMPFKLLLFVLVNGWGLIITALVASLPDELRPADRRADRGHARRGPGRRLADDLPAVQLAADPGPGQGAAVGRASRCRWRPP